MLKFSDILKKYKEKSKKTEPVETKPELKKEIRKEGIKPVPPPSQAQEAKISIFTAVDKGFGEISSAEIAKLYEEVLSFTKQIYMSKPEQYPTAAINTLIEKLVDAVCQDKNEELIRICVADYLKNEDYLYSHVVNVCILAIEIGMGLGYERPRLIELAIAALLHDIGIVKYLDIINKNEILSKEEYEKVKEHPNSGREILTTIDKELSSTLIDVVSQEHERIDGSGYPNGLKGDEISEYAKIVSLADVYEAMLHYRPYRNKFTALDTIKKILEIKEALESRLIKILIEKVTIFPVGISVRLNTKEIGVVAKKNPGLPLRPVVKIIFDSYGRELKQPKQIDLAVNSAIYIKDCLKGLPSELSYNEGTT